MSYVGLEIMLIWLIGVHEFGHLAIARILGLPARLRIKHWSIPVAAVRVETAVQSLLVASGGPLLSLLVGYLLIFLGYTSWGIWSLIFGVFSLIPFKHNDGWRIFMFRRSFA